jgi:hypothetical protein
MKEGTTLTLFRNIINKKNTDRSSSESTTVPQISTHLMMAE